MAIKQLRHNRLPLSKLQLAEKSPTQNNPQTTASFPKQLLWRNRIKASRREPHLGGVLPTDLKPPQTPDHGEVTRSGKRPAPNPGFNAPYQNLGPEFGAGVCYRSCAYSGFGFAAAEKLDGIKKGCKPSQGGMGCAMPGTASDSRRCKDRPPNYKRTRILLQIFPTNEAPPFSSFSNMGKFLKIFPLLHWRLHQHVHTHTHTRTRYTVIPQVCFSDLPIDIPPPFFPPSPALRFPHSAEAPARLDSL